MTKPNNELSPEAKKKLIALMAKQIPKYEAQETNKKGA